MTKHHVRNRWLRQLPVQGWKQYLHMFTKTTQHTVAKEVSCTGVGVHSGKTVTLTIKPARPNHGIQFQRIDLPGTRPIPALFHLVVDTSLATVIGQEGVIVSTIEHLMATFAGMGIDNALVTLTNYEMPIMDGSASVFAEMIQKAGAEDQHVPRYFFVVKRPIEVSDGDKFVGIYPDDAFKITCTIEYPHPVIQSQTYTVDLTGDAFAPEISRARTFGFLHELEFLKQNGLARGATLDSGIAIDAERVINEDGLRFEDEFVRHKILDCIGDFSLIGMPIMGHVKARKSGHAFNNAFIREFFKKKDCWETRPVEEITER